MSRTISVAALTAGGINNDKKVIYKKYSSFADWIGEINNTQVYNAKSSDKVIAMFNLI